MMSFMSPVFPVFHTVEKVRFILIKNHAHPLSLVSHILTTLILGLNLKIPRPENTESKFWSKNAKIINYYFVFCFLLTHTLYIVHITCSQKLRLKSP